MIVAPKHLDVYRVQGVHLGHSKDIRPCIICEVDSAGRLWGAVVSGQMDMFEGPPKHFKIDREDPDFLFTGLTRTCYATGDVVEIHPNQLMAKLGILQGELAKAFEKWC